MSSTSSSPSDSITRPRRRARVNDDSNTRKNDGSLFPSAAVVSGSVSHNSAASSTKPSVAKRQFGRSLSSNAVVTATSKHKNPLRDRKISAMFSSTSESHTRGPLSSSSSKPLSRTASVNRGVPSRRNTPETIILDDIDDIEEIYSDNDASVASVSQKSIMHKSGGSAAATVLREKSGTRTIVKKPSFLTSRAFKTIESVKPKVDETSTIHNAAPWTDLYTPRDLSELAVHKKKVDDVRSWVDGVFNQGDRKRLLVLKGPAGSGKTTTLRLLAKELGVRLIEWKTPPADAFEHGYTSAAGKLEEFLTSAARYGSLSFTSTSSPSDPVTASGSASKELILMEEFLFSSYSLAEFRNVILSYLQANTPSYDDLYHQRGNATRKVTPLVMIITETNLSTASFARDNDNLTAHRLLGPEILTHPSTSVIEFNPIATTFMQKALELILRRECSVSGRTTVPGDGVLQQLSRLGDIRSAISSLQFIYLNPDPSGFSGRMSSSSNKRKRGGTTQSPTLTKAERQSLQITSLRESTLGIFHAVGKVVYNTRIDPPATMECPVGKPNPYFPQYTRTRIPELDPDQLMAELGTDLQTFIAAIQENYLLSCNTDFDPEATTECMAMCVEDLSNADVLAPTLLGAGGTKGRAGQSRRMGSAVDELRQEEMSFNVAVRGTVFALPSPVQRVGPPPVLSPSVLAIRTGNHSTGVSAGSEGEYSADAESSRRGGRGPAGGGAGDAVKMFFPTSLRIWRLVEEVDDLVGVMMNRLVSGRFCPNSKSNGVRTQLSSLSLNSQKVASQGHSARPTTKPGLGRSSQPHRSSLPFSSSQFRVYRQQRNGQSGVQLSGSLGYRPSSSGPTISTSAGLPPKNHDSGPARHAETDASSDTELESSQPLLSRTVSRADMLLDILPYSMKIRAARARSVPHRDPRRDKFGAELCRISALVVPGSGDAGGGGSGGGGFPSSLLANATAGTAITVPRDGWEEDEENGVGFGGEGSTVNRYSGPDFSGAEAGAGSAWVLSDDDIDD